MVSRLSVTRRLERPHSSQDRAHRPNLQKQRMSSLLNHRKQEENSLQYQTGGSSTPATQKRGPSNFSRKRNSVCLSVDKKKTPVLLSQRRELLTISSFSSSKYGRVLKKKGWNSSKLQALTREVGSSPRPPKRNVNLFTSSSETKRELTPSYSWYEERVSF